MGYRIRILGKNPDSPPFKELQQVAIPALLEADEGTEANWEAAVLKHPSDVPIAFIEKNLVVPGELGQRELDEFIEDVSRYGPLSAAEWLKVYLPGVKVIYSFQLLHGTEINKGFDRMNRVYEAVWRHAGGILQADQEGFSNEYGFMILWQLDEGAKGRREMSVLNQEGKWIHFEMSLGNARQREAFLRGEVPNGVKLIQPS
jgi:hypothetical protein